jgi:membrane-bound metal-dependent hydrolase YbcI (DUF457 family)
MNIFVHGLMALALARGFFPRRGWSVAVGMIVAGTIADVDAISGFFGPSAYLEWHRTYTHSLVGTLCVVGIGVLIAIWLGARKSSPFAWIVVAITVAAVAHLMMDLWQSDGVTLLWPIRSTRFAADFVPGADPWILGLLMLGLGIPEIFRLVNSEIGAKDKSPRGRNGAIVALALILIYVGARDLLHANALAEMDAHAYRGESPRTIGAFADSLSIFTWHGVAETQSLMCLVDVKVGPWARFDADGASCQHKPEPTAALELAQKTAAAREFLRVERFPKATVEKTQDGYEVGIRSMRDFAEMESERRAEVRVYLNAVPHVLEEELKWVRSLRER